MLPVAPVRRRLDTGLGIATLSELHSTSVLELRRFGLELPPVDAAIMEATLRWGWIAAVVTVVGAGLWSERRAARGDGLQGGAPPAP